MRKLLLTAAALALAASSLLAPKADAMSLGAPSGVRSAADSLGIVEKTQYFYGGRNYCWYPDGWNGPGFYWCGYAFRPGFGWGGPIGWRGWRGGYGGRGGVVVGPGGGVGVVGPGGGRAFVGGGGGHRMMGGGGAGPRMGGGGGGPRMGGGGGRGGGGGGGRGGGPHH